MDMIPHRRILPAHPDPKDLRFVDDENCIYLTDIGENKDLTWSGVSSGGREALYNTLHEITYKHYNESYKHFLNNTWTKFETTALLSLMPRVTRSVLRYINDPDINSALVMMDDAMLNIYVDTLFVKLDVIPHDSVMANVHFTGKFSIYVKWATPCKLLNGDYINGYSK